ncbi:hypothetical protein [Arcticibacterium luteifluviistationis]|uniref:DUF3078 domain-containing protein n=1 Tax=Arcticibacterium luteifluviistationis TaxID=1784714 RepID=A0A2Z4GGR9_9BACT|nr:hypothetical protein [Arcticibacterium luteifluviistationis]AWW00481.1 hypothetical protein DJ013_20780 [Arcticibacterium luteifluviistationis]
MNKILVALLYLTSQFAFSQSPAETIPDTLDLEIETTEEELEESSWEFLFTLGLNVSHAMERNNPSGTDNKGFATNNSLDIGVNYIKENARFNMTNDFHYTIGLLKDGGNSNLPLKRTSDDLSSFHDFSISSKKNQKWNVNLIAKIFTSALKVYDGDFLKDEYQTGQIQGFFNPYDISFSPGIKFQPDDYLRISLSPYSVNLYGLTNQSIANTGFYTDSLKSNGDYIKKVTSPLGAEVNVWYDRSFKEWLELQYRVGVSSNYFTNIAKNGLLDGLFITKVKLFSDVYLMHRATLQVDFTNKPLKPHYQRTILLSFSKSF